MTIEGEAGASDEPALPEAVIADLRADDRRRHVLTRLAESERALPVSDLARYVAATERDEAVDDVSADEADAVRRDVFQEHLPKLTATGVVRYDSLVGTVELATDDERLFDAGADVDADDVRDGSDRGSDDTDGEPESRATPNADGRG